MQDYRGFRSKGRKAWIDDFGFNQIPKEVFIEYDQMRQQLADEVLLAIENTIVDSHLTNVVRKLEPADYRLMETIKDYGPIYHQKVYDTFGKDLGKKVLTRLKSRGVISLMVDPKSGYSKYDLNEIGIQILRENHKPSQSDFGKFNQLINCPKQKKRKVCLPCLTHPFQTARND